MVEGLAEVEGLLRWFFARGRSLPEVVVAEPVAVLSAALDACCWAAAILSHSSNFPLLILSCLHAFFRLLGTVVSPVSDH